MGLAQFDRMLKAATADTYTQALYQEGMTPPAADCQRLAVAMLRCQAAFAAHDGYHATADQEEALWLARQEVQAACKAVGINHSILGAM